MPDPVLTPAERAAARERRYRELVDEVRLGERRGDGISAGEDFAQGVNLGLGRTGTAAARGLGWLAGKVGLEGVGSGLESWADRTDAEMQEYYDPHGTAGTAGSVTGRIVGEVGTTIAGGRGVAKAITSAAPASRLARALMAGRRGTVAQRVAAETLPFVPVDAALGAGGSEDGFVLPGRAGAAIENVAMGALPTAAIEGAVARREVARAAEESARQSRATAAGLAGEQAWRDLVTAETGPALARRGEREARVAALYNEPPSPISQAIRDFNRQRAEAVANRGDVFEVPRPVPPPGADTRPMREILQDWNSRSPGMRAVEEARAGDELAARDRRLPVPVDETRVLTPMTQYADEAAPGTAWMDRLAERARGLQETALERDAIAAADAPASSARTASGRLPANLAQVETQALVDELARTYDNVGADGVAPTSLENEYGDVWTGIKDYRAVGRNAARQRGAERIEAELVARGVDVDEALAKAARGEQLDGSTDFPFGLLAPDALDDATSFADAAVGRGGVADGGSAARLASRPGGVARELLESMGGGAIGAAVGGAATGDVRGVVGGAAAGAGAPSAARGISRIARDVREAPRLRRSVAELTEQRDLLQRAADTDALTELGNARAYRAALATAEADPATAVIRFDANGFKGVNDALGHEAGDGVLREMADALRTGAGDGGRVFRVGGDEFAVLAPADGADAVRQRIEAAFGVREVAPGVRVSLSGGTGATDAAADLAARASKRAAKAAQGIANRPGAARSAVVNALGGGALGATAGVLVGEDPTARRRNAVVGAAAGLAGGAAATPLLKAAARTPRRSALFSSDPDVATIAKTIRRGDRPAAARADGLLGFARRAYQQLVNESYAAEQLGRLAGTGDAVKQAIAQSHGWEGATEQFLKDEFRGVLDAARGVEEDVMALVKAQRAMEQAQRGVADKTGIPLEVHARARAALEAQPEVKRAADRLRAFYRQLLELKRDHGVISPAQYDQIVASEDFYTPFVREWDDRPTIVGGPRGGKNVQRGTGVRKLDLEQQARADTVDPFEIAVLDAGETFRSIAKQRVTDAVVAAYHADPTAVAPFLRPMAATEAVSPGARVVEANVAGRRTRWEVTDKDLYEAFGAFDQVERGILVKLLSYGKRGLQVGVTFMPDFAIANAMRDTTQAAIQQGRVAREVAAGTAAGGVAGAAFGDDEESLALRTLKGMGFGAGVGALGPQALKNLRAVGDILGNSAAYQQFLREGGYTMGFYPKNQRDARAVLERLRSTGVSASDIVSPSRWVDLVNAIGRTSEQATRLAKWKELKAAGADVGERVLGAQDVSLRFSQQGSGTKALAATTAFWNAKVQGWDKLARMLKDPRTWALGAGAITAPSLALWEINRDNPEYWQRPLWERNAFWLLPKGGEAGGFWRIPKPFEIGFLFASLPERLAEFAANKGLIDSASPFRGIATAGDLLGEAVSGMAGTTLEGTVPLPTLPMAVAEQVFNRDLFFDRDIVTRPDLPAEQQVDERTSSLALGAGKLGLSPQRVDALVADLTGATGVTALRAIDKVARALGLDERAPAPGQRRLLVGRFETSPGSWSDAEEMLRRRFERVDRTKRGYDNLKRTGASMEELDAYMEANRAALEEYFALQPAVDLTREMRAMLRDSRRDPSLTAEQRETMARRATAVAAELAARALRGETTIGEPDE